MAGLTKTQLTIYLTKWLNPFDTNSAVHWGGAYATPFRGAARRGGGRWIIGGEGLPFSCTRGPFCPSYRWCCVRIPFCDRETATDRPVDRQSARQALGGRGVGERARAGAGVVGTTNDNNKGQ